MTMLIIMSTAVLTGITIWWLLIQRLQTKPWIEKGIAERSVTTMPPARVGLRLFFGTMTSVFSVLIVSYLVRMQHGEHDWQPLAEPSLLWFNTALLILASLSLQRARGAAGREQLDSLKVNWTVGGVLTIGFVLGQLWAWHELIDAGYYLRTGPAVGFFYFLTAVHGLHLLGGLWVWSRTTVKVWHGLDAKKDPSAIGAVRLSVQLCSVYWHYLLLVWLVLFALLLMT
jgi:cytochrome c oxidase subunit III